jgi:hypothetical protein
MAVNFRQQARDALLRAKDELGSNVPERLKYAALELRMAMECLTYERASGYESELPSQEYETWQPRKLMLLLLEIDPNADKDSSIAVGKQDVPGTPAETVTSLGTERVLSLETIKRHYDALGSFLHIPTFKQLKKGGDIDHTKLRTRCILICSEIELTLASPVWNINFGIFSEIACERCGKIVRKRLPKELTTSMARCFECGATYDLAKFSQDQVSWKLIQQTVQCRASACGKAMFLVEADIEAGKCVKCLHCGGMHDIDLMIRLREPTRDL